MRFYLASLLFLALFLVGCGGESQEAAPSQLPASPTTEAIKPLTATPAPTSTIGAGAPAPQIKLLGATADTCVMTDTTQSTVLSFDAHYYHTTANNYFTAVMKDSDGVVLAEVASAAEERNGEGGFGIYPNAYNLPDETLITLTVITYRGADSSSERISIAELTYNCTTGETVWESFETIEPPQ